MPSLLPPNRTALETALSLAIGPRLFGDPLPLAGFKTAPTDGMVPWLIWEYGLDELLPYLTDPRQVLRDGVQFQRLRGTEASLRMALGWVGFSEAVIEEAGPGPWWAQLQLDPGAVPSDADVRRIIGVATLALPARTHLVRLYHGYDIRPIVLDVGPALDDGMLDDDSGVNANGVRLSFGRTLGLSAQAGTADRQPSALHSRTGLASVYPDDGVLDWWELDSEITVNHRVGRLNLYAGSTTGLPTVIGSIGASRYPIARADFVLDETALDAVTAMLDPFMVIEEGAPLTLDVDPLDDYQHALRRVPVEELFEHAVALSAAAAIAPTVSLAIHQFRTLAGTPEDAELVLDGDPPERAGWRVTVRSVTTGCAGPYRPLWPTARWGAHGWDDPVVSVAMWTIPAAPIDPDAFPAWTVTPWSWWTEPSVWAGGWTGGWLADLTPPSESGV